MKFASGEPAEFRVLALHESIISTTIIGYRRDSILVNYRVQSIWNNLAAGIVRQRQTNPGRHKSEKRALDIGSLNRTQGTRIYAVGLGVAIPHVRALQSRTST